MNWNGRGADLVRFCIDNTVGVSLETGFSKSCFSLYILVARSKNSNSLILLKFPDMQWFFFLLWGWPMRGQATDHVISGPMRGLTKNCIRWLTQTDKHTNRQTLWLNRPSVAESLKSPKNNKITNTRYCWLRICPHIIRSSQVGTLGLHIQKLREKLQYLFNLQKRWFIDVFKGSIWY